VAFWALMACCLVFVLSYAMPLPDPVVMTVLIVLPLSLLVWAVAVFRDARETGSSLGQAAWKSIKGALRAAWEVVMV